MTVKITCVEGPSNVGKTTLIDEQVRIHRQAGNFAYAISMNKPEMICDLFKQLVEDTPPSKRSLIEGMSVTLRSPTMNSQPGPSGESTVNMHFPKFMQDLACIISWHLFRVANAKTPEDKKQSHNLATLYHIARLKTRLIKLVEWLAKFIETKGILPVDKDVYFLIDRSPVSTFVYFPKDTTGFPSAEEFVGNLEASLKNKVDFVLIERDKPFAPSDYHSESDEHFDKLSVENHAKFTEAYASVFAEMAKQGYSVVTMRNDEGVKNNDITDTTNPSIQ